MTSIATYSYGIAAFAFLILSFMLMTRWRSRTHASAITLASLATMLWGAVLAWQSTQLVGWSAWSDALEVVRSAAWCAFLLILLGNYRNPDSTLPFKLNVWVLAVATFFLVFFFGTVAGYWHLEMVHTIGLMPSVTARVAIAVLGIVLVEQLYRNKSMQERWAVKFACLGIGAMFAYDFYLYSNAMLFQAVDPDIWAARGLINALTVPLIAFSIGRSASWSAGGLALSRRVMFHTAALFGSAIYLLAMGSAGYYLRFVGGSWGTVMQMAFLFGALILLVVILFSGTFRSWLKVFISKHFYRYNYDYREEWLRFTRTLSEAGPGLGVRTIQAVAELVESPGGVLFVKRESGRYVPDAYWHVPAVDVAEAADSPFSQFLESKQWVVDLIECQEQPQLYDDVPMPAWLKQFPRARLIVPLIMQNKLFGFMLLTQPRSRVVFNWEVIDLLKIAGNQAASYLAQQEAATALMVARQFESFNRMSTFVVHDLKNLVSQLSLMILNAEKHRDNPEFQRDMLDTVDYSVQKMRLLLQKLSRSESPEHMAPLAIDKVLTQAVALKAAFEPHPVLDIAESGLKVLADRERLERVLGHLIQNAIEATPRDGTVSVALRRGDGEVVITVADTGAGMSEQFIRERLFKPFESTKSAGMGIGVFESREYIGELGGRLDVISAPGAGTTIHVMLPLYRPEAHNSDTAVRRPEEFS
ncbi:PEP-CTERM system histidine kinase PrsK [Massilia sp. PAMC28688]|uniref:XrtA/PEP-CTERM system histidine kinase PrsK n=1 Tax=Massilia sp. PAMC28688 TaxID=2861283 RepID=UPI001C6328D8|nr:XrtA/PEP-CTERM system histidine kinase PrsK [Massilia sp. PAMC28688]QYF95076.1 PEP-CTERM system histidine kinase PrsK [Massilia sp. PAMC28688]